MGRRNVCDELFFSLLGRCERLEEQLNDLTDLHQSEIPTMKQELARMDEKITYHSHEIARDIQVSLSTIHSMFLFGHQSHSTDWFCL